MMADTSEEAPKYEICFIQTGESTEESTEILKHAFEAVHKNQFDPVWITVDECLKISKKEPKLFVVDPFEGLAFEHLKTFQCRIIGPLSIVYCLQYGEVLPKRSYPIYSVSMRKITVACSNIAAKLRDEISSRVQLMGGFFSKDLTKSVTHLIVGEVGSQKYKVAANCGLPVMIPEWVSDLWENGQHKQLHATDSCYDKYKCPVFKGLVITVSQLNAEERLAVKQVVEENGGSYLGALKANETTHLILNEPTGDKYRFAKNWNVICVNVKWIYESVESGYCRDEKLYGLDASAQVQPKRSTPKKNNTLCDMPLVDCSAIIVPAPALSHLDETMKSDISILVSGKKDSFVQLDEFNLSSLPKYGQFLDGCKIFLTGFSPPRMDKLRKIVNSGGGMRFNKYSDSISHVVCGELAEDLLQNIRSSSVKPFVVNYKWLLECCKNSMLVDEKPYLCVDVTTLSPEKNQEKEQKKDVPIPVSQNSSQTKKDNFTNDNMTDIFRQYISGQQQEDDKENKGDFADSRNMNLKPKTVTGEFRKSSSINVEVKCDELPQVNIPVIDLESVNQAETLQADNDVEVIDDDISCTRNLFAGMKFTIVGFGEKDSEILSGMIEAHAGVITSQRNQVDIAIVPLIWYDLTIPVSNIVTNCWLQKCIEESRIFDFDENELFRPFDLAVDKKPFESLVISISQYAGTERDCLIHLCESLGATCQEYFVRKANVNKGVLANTHLVVSIPDGSKYEASKKWKIPAVTKQWVIDAAKMGMAAHVDDYLVEEFPDFPRCEEVTTTQNNSVLSQKVEKNNVSKNNKSDKTVSSSHVSHNPLPIEPCIKENSKLSSNLQTNCADTETVESDKTLQTAKEVTPLVPLQHSRVAELCNASRRESIKMSSPVRPLGETSLDASLSLDKTNNFKFDVSGILRDLDASGARESFASNKSLSVGEMFGRNLAVALQRFGDISDLENDNSKVFEENIASEKSSILKGVVMYVSRKLSDIQIELNEIVIQLGGSYIWSYNETCTHFVFTGKLNDITKEFREARSHGKKIVHPEWVYACKEKGIRVEEGTYPHTYKADMTLSQQISIQKAPVSNVPKEVVSDVVAEEVTKVDIPVESKPVALEKNKEVDFNKQLNELLVLAKSAKKRQSKRGVNSVSSSPVGEISPVQKLQRHLSDVYIKQAPAASDNVNEEPDTCSQLSQSYPITWDDPTGRLEREKIAARAAKIAELKRKSKLDENCDQIVENEELDVDVLHKGQTTKKFMLTNIADSLKAEYEGIIKKLGGEVSDEKAFDITATHLILSNPIKNEKFLSSVASGKWVLHPQYLSASVELNKFVDEEEYEWGGPSTEKFLKNLSSGSAKIAQCPFRWRSKLQGGLITTGAFDSWKVKIVADDATKLATYSKILEAGGAEIVPAESSESALEGVSHVFVDVKKKNPNKVDLSNYLSRNIKCIKPEYLAFYLIEDPQPNVDNFLVTEAKEHFGGGSSSKRRNLSTSSTSRQGKKIRLK